MKYLALVFLFTVGGYSNLVGASGSEQDAVAAVVPVYPVEAARKGVEGYVTLKFDIDEQGQPINIRVLKASPEGVFDKAAINALSRARYTPKVVNGIAMVQPGQSMTLDFSLNKTKPSKSKTAKHAQVIQDKKLVNGIQKTFGLVTNGKLDEALAVAQSLKPTTPYEQAFMDRVLGLIYADKGDTTNAIAYLTKAVDAQLLEPIAQESASKRLAHLKAQ